MIVRFLPPGATVPEDAAEFRNSLNRELLVHVAPEGVYAWAKRAQTRHLLSWQDVLSVPGVREALVCAMMREVKEEQAV